MEKKILNYGGLVLFYSVIILGVLLLNMRFSYLNQHDNLNPNNNYLAMEK